MIKIIDEYDIQYFSRRLQEKLNEGAIKREFISTFGLRSIGKTHALIIFARKFNLSVIVSNRCIADSLREKYDYKKIYTCGDNFRGRNDLFVFDEGVDIGTLDIDVSKVVTGYVNF